MGTIINCRHTILMLLYQKLRGVVMSCFKGDLLLGLKCLLEVIHTGLEEVAKGGRRAHGHGNLFRWCDFGRTTFKYRAFN